MTDHPANDAARLARRIAERTERAVAETAREIRRLTENDAAILMALEARDRNHRGWGG